MSLDVVLEHRYPGLRLDVAFTTGEARVTALFGPSGAGKSTTIDAIAGLRRLDAGRITLDGRVLFDRAAGKDVAPAARRIGYVFQDARLFPHLSVESNLRYGWRRAGARRPGQRTIDDIVDLLGLGALLGRRPRALSGGERQRVALGRALLRAPDLLLLDEPLAGLDRARREEILPYLERSRDATSVRMLYVSHAVDEVARLAERVVLLRDGSVRAEGTPGELFARPELLGPEDARAGGALLDAEVRAHDRDYALTELTLAAGTLAVPALAATPGTRVRVHVSARDVTLSLAPPELISANNVLEGQIVSITAHAGPEADVHLDCAGQLLTARITRKSVDRLALAPGRRVYALIKTITLDE